MRLTRRGLLLGGTAAATVLLPRAAEASRAYVVGAIRWDAWYGTGTVNAAVRASLGPAQFQSRMPWFGMPTSTHTVAIDGNQQATMDAEIGYADGAGINYWAYCWYGPSDPMQLAWQLHQASGIRNQVNWCLLLQFGSLGGAAGMSAVQAAWIGYMQQANYQKVTIDGVSRPLIYIYLDDFAGTVGSSNLTSTSLSRAWGGSYAAVKSAFDALRSACTAAGLGTPYIVPMYYDPPSANVVRTSIGADAISNYTTLAPAGQPAPYAAQVAADAAFWASMASAGAPLVPIVQTGWDTRPRKLNPPGFAKQVPGSGMLNYVQAGTAAQIASNFQAALNYAANNATMCPSKAILAYSWNECDEGGSVIMPTYASSGPNRAILDAIASVLTAN